MVDLKFEDVYFNYSDEARILHGINLELSDPGLVCIIGPNGVGKSTLVKCINQLLKGPYRSTAGPWANTV